jgi:hypothetical protein
MGFRHPAKADAVDTIWRDREHHYRRYHAANDRMAALAALPGIGPVTKHRLALALELFETSPHGTTQASPSGTFESSPHETTEEHTGVVTNAF